MQASLVGSQALGWGAASQWVAMAQAPPVCYVGFAGVLPVCNLRGSVSPKAFDCGLTMWCIPHRGDPPDPSLTSLVVVGALCAFSVDLAVEPHPSENELFEKWLNEKWLNEIRVFQKKRNILKV